MLAGLLFIAPVAAAGDDAGGLISVQVENDLFGSGLDRHYTNGLRLNYISPELSLPPWAERVAVALPGIDPTCDECALRVSYVLGQNMFTPEEISTPALVADDRPYAGWLYGGVGLVVSRDQGPNRARLDFLELNVGMVGPASLAEPVQRVWHRWVDAPEPRGWKHQLANEPGLNAYFTRQWQLLRPSPSGGLKFDLIPHVGYALGNVHTYLAGGATLRLGSHLAGDFGPPRIRPSLPTGGFFKGGRERLDWYLFAGVEGRAIARNIFLDGNSFTDSHRVDREPLVGDLQAGLVLTYGDLRFSFTNVWRSREFEGQRGDSRFGAFSLSWRF